MTVDAASMNEKAESIPSMKRVKDRRTDQKLAPGRVSIAAG